MHFLEIEKNVKDSTFIVVKNESCSQEDDGTSDYSDRSSISCKDHEQSKIVALEVEIQILKDELIFAREEVGRLKNSAQ